MVRAAPEPLRGGQWSRRFIHQPRQHIAVRHRPGTRVAPRIGFFEAGGGECGVGERERVPGRIADFSRFGVVALGLEQRQRQAVLFVEQPQFKLVVRGKGQRRVIFQRLQDDRLMLAMRQRAAFAFDPFACRPVTAERVFAMYLPDVAVAAVGQRVVYFNHEQHAPVGRELADGVAVGVHAAVSPCLGGTARIKPSQISG